jgi:hypothetical protein
LLCMNIEFFLVEVTASSSNEDGRRSCSRRSQSLAARAQSVPVLSGIELTCSTGGFGGVWRASHIFWAACRRRPPNERKRMTSLATICLAPSNKPFISMSFAFTADVRCE